VPAFERDARSIAHHEAGHAVVLDCIGMPISRIEASPTRGQVSIDIEAVRRCSEVPMDDAAKERAACQLAAGYMAGLQAELILHDIRPGGMVLPDDHDHRAARTILCEVCGTAISLGYCQLLARHFLTTNWPNVQRLADRLQICGEMDL
jgi:hypothetical protein